MISLRKISMSRYLLAKDKKKKKYRDTKKYNVMEFNKWPTLKKLTITTCVWGQREVLFQHYRLILA